MALSGSSSAVVRYTRVAVALHWLLAAALVGQVVLGSWMIGLPKSPPGLRAGWFNVHKSIGITIALFVLLRIVWRVTHEVPGGEPGPAWRRNAARTVHRLLYFCMALMPLTGFLGSSFTAYPIRYFGVVLPTPHVDWPLGKQLMSDLHYGTANDNDTKNTQQDGAAGWHWWHRDGVAARMGSPSPR